MKQRQLGKGGPMVGAIGLGCMSFGGPFGPTTEADSFAAMDAAWENGITFFDTANVYGGGVSETVMGKWMKATGHRPVLATKAGIFGGPPRSVRNDREYLIAELDGSLKRLGTDHVDLFYIHRHETGRPIEEVAETMRGLIDAGKIGGWGLSEVAPYTLRRAHAATPVRAVQNEYSLWSRQPELGLLQECARLGVAFVPFSPLARGIFGRVDLQPEAFLPGDFRLGIPRFDAENWPRNAPVAARFRAFAAEHGVSAAALALAWVLAQGDHLIPIPGTRTALHLSDWLGADTLDLAPLLPKIDAMMPVGWASGDRYNDNMASTVERYS